MRVVQNPAKLQTALARLKRQDKKIGFVPTMGYLHEGHLSLVRLARKENDVVVASIFVNPLQFGPREDFKRYPRDFPRDARLLKKEKADFLLAPAAEEFYPKDFQTEVKVTRLSGRLCGASRPAHFAGVCTVVLKLLNIVKPDRLYLGQKDYQQVEVIGQMVKDLGFSVMIRMAPIVREPDGLAMSSRNVLLSKKEREEAPCLHRALCEGARLVKRGVRDAGGLQKPMREILKRAASARVDYLEIVDVRTLRPVVKLKKGQKALLTGAVFFKKTRLIDNELVRV